MWFFVIMAALIVFLYLWDKSGNWARKRSHEKWLRELDEIHRLAELRGELPRGAGIETPRHDMTAEKTKRGWRVP